MPKLPHWQVFNIYNLYRFILIIILLFNFKVNDSVALFFLEAKDIFTGGLSLYLLSIGAFYLCTRRKDITYETLIVFSALVDMCFLNVLFLFSHGFDAGIGILLNIAIAAIAIMLPGLKALFFCCL